jgi:hypothetical protein
MGQAHFTRIVSSIRRQGPARERRRKPSFYSIRFHGFELFGSFVHSNVGLQLVDPLP